MQSNPTTIPDVLILEPRVFEDDRGFFYESYNQRAFDQAVGAPVRFVQDNHSRSARGTLRGLHYQLPPHAQGKLVRVTAGEVFDVAVDIRKDSPVAFGQRPAGTSRRKPPAALGVARLRPPASCVTSDVAELPSRCTRLLRPRLARASIRWDDTESLGIRWPGRVLKALRGAATEQPAPAATRAWLRQGADRRRASGNRPARSPAAR
ncbi:MAG: dTDP-4-dehydrorhamnose 3,5-epimerase family protein [Arhodomonas sp.]|nr:dTDP-4-dehydrorhamnose 3,5-epimerase family protein [Arhodomonas sp.]